MTQDLPNPDALYDSFDKNLYRITGSEEENNIMDQMQADPAANNSNNVQVSASDMGGGVSTATTTQQAGGAATQQGKSTFDNTVPGYILGFDPKDGYAKFYIGNATNYLNWTGTALNIKGTITATSGTIGGWQINTTTLSANSGAVILDSAGQITLGTSNSVVVLSSTDPTYRLWAGNATGLVAPFSVSAVGAITATAGIIGGFTITTTTLYGGTVKTSATVGLGSNGVIMDSAGLRGYDAILGQTFNLPTDGSAPTFSSGRITETIFDISTNAVLRTSSTVGDGTSSSAGVLINNTGIYGLAANQTPSTANFRILVTGGGSLTFNASGYVRGGQTDFNTGVGFFLGYSSGDYKFSIGSTTNYLTWDGSFLKIKGSFDVGTNGIINNSSYTVANLPVPPTSVGFNVPSAFE